LSEQTASPSGDLTWEIGIPVLSNRVIVGGLVRVFAITGVTLSAFMAVLLGSQGDWEIIAPVSLGFLLACAGLLLLCLVAMAALLRDRMQFRFTISGDGVRMESLDRRVWLVNRLAIGTGSFSGASRMAGVGLTSAGRESEEALWSGSFRARYDEGAHVIVLRNSWRGLLYVYCTPEVYPLAVARIGSEIEAHGTEKRGAKRLPVTGS
jgi:hypothetical protein